MKRLLAATLTALISFSAFSEGIGLILSGGGAKGAYEVGVWKAMNEYGLDKKTLVISGTSVGGLNAALFSCCTLQEAEELWKNEVGYTSFLMPDEASIDGIKSYIVNYTGESSPILDYFTTGGESAGFFDRKPLRTILDRYVTLEKINKSGKMIYVTTLRKENLAANAGAKTLATLFSSIGLIDNVPQDYSSCFALNNQISDSNIRDLLMATSALPLVYPSQTLNADVVQRNGEKLGKPATFIDGGFEAVGGNNVPAGPALEADNIDTVFVVYLKSEDELESKVDFSTSEKRIVEFVPSRDLGDMMEGTLNFSEEKIQELIQLGYDDASRTLEENGYRKSFFRRIFSFFHEKGGSVTSASTAITFGGISLGMIALCGAGILVLLIIIIAIIATTVKKSKKRNSKSHSASMKKS